MTLVADMVSWVLILGGGFFLVVGGIGVGFHKHPHRIHSARFIQLDLEVGRKPACGHNLLLDLRRKDIHTAQDDHIVAASGDLLHPPH